MSEEALQIAEERREAKGKGGERRVHFWAFLVVGRKLCSLLDERPQCLTGSRPEAP